MSGDLFTVSSVELDEFSAIVVANISDVEYAFIPFTEWLEDTDQVADFQNINDQEQMFGIFMTYCMEFIDDELMDEQAPVIKQAIFLGDNCIVLTLDLEEEVADYINSSYPEIEDIEAMLLSEDEEREESNEMEGESEEDMEEDDDDDFRL